MQSAAAHGVERSLEDMRELHQRLEAEDAGPAFHRMHGAEHRIDCVVRLQALAQAGEPLLHVLKQFDAFVEEGILKLIKSRHGLGLVRRSRLR